MDLDEYLFYEKKKDPSFSNKKFAKKLGISQVHLSRILSGKFAFSAKVAIKISKITSGKVDIIKLLKKSHPEEKKRNEN